MLRATRVGCDSHWSGDTTASSALTWKYSSTSTVKKCVVVECAGESAEDEDRFETIFGCDGSHFKCQIRNITDSSAIQWHLLPAQRDSASVARTTPPLIGGLRSRVLLRRHNHQPERS